MKRKKKLLICCSVALALALILCGCFFGDRLLNGQRLKIREDIPVRVDYCPNGDAAVTRAFVDKKLTEEFMAFLKDFRYDDYFIPGASLGWNANLTFYFQDDTFFFVDIRSDQSMIVDLNDGKHPLTIYYPKDTAAYQEKRKYFLEKFSTAAGFPVKTEWENFSESAGLP